MHFDGMMLFLEKVNSKTKLDTAKQESAQAN